MYRRRFLRHSLLAGTGSAIGLTRLLGNQPRGGASRLQLILREGSVAYGGYNRTYSYLLPESEPAHGYKGLVLFFHGNGSDGKTYMQTMDPDHTLSQKYGYLFIFPDGVLGSWNSGHGFGPAFASGIDDVGAVNLMIKTLRQEHYIDGEIFLVGSSNGGCLAYRLAAELEKVAGEKISAFAPLSATIGGIPKDQSVLIKNFPENVFQASFFAVHGYRDTTIKFNSFTRSGTERVDIPFPESTSVWLNYIGRDPRRPIKVIENDEFIKKWYIGRAEIENKKTVSYSRAVTKIYKKLGHLLSVDQRLLGEIMDYFTLPSERKGRE